VDHNISTNSPTMAPVKLTEVSTDTFKR